MILSVIKIFRNMNTSSRLKNKRNHSWIDDSKVVELDETKIKDRNLQQIGRCDLHSDFDETNSNDECDMNGFNLT